MKTLTLNEAQAPYNVALDEAILADEIVILEKGLRVVTFPDDYVLLGRDILNYFYVQLNGPDLTFELSLTPF